MVLKLQKAQTIEALIRYGAALFDAEELYFGHGTDNSMDEAAYIVLTITGDLPVSDEQVFLNEVNETDSDNIKLIFERRIAEKVPAAYLLGEAWFAGLPFFVNEHVLVPRSPFAELIDDKFAPWVDVSQVKNILDLCAGSGCIGIACAVNFPEANVDLADISSSALAVANRNIENHKLNGRVATIESDLLSGLAGKKYDVIVSNPPYVGHEELSSLPDEFHQEPQLGLDGGVSGLDLVHKILADASCYLNDGGVLYVEVGNTDEALQQCYSTVPFLWQDFEYGGHGVFMLTKAQLLEYKNLFQAKLSK